MLIFFVLVIVIGCVGIAFWTQVFGQYHFDIALFGVGVSLVLWIITFYDHVLFSILGLFACFNTIIIMWDYRPIHCHKTRLCYQFR